MHLGVECVLHHHPRGPPDEIERPLRRREFDQLHPPHLDPVILSGLRKHFEDLRRDVVEITEIGKLSLALLGQCECAGEGRPGLFGTFDQPTRLGHLARAEQHERLQPVANLLIGAVE